MLGLSMCVSASTWSFLAELVVGDILTAEHAYAGDIHATYCRHVVDSQCLSGSSHTFTILAVSLPVAKCAQPDMDADMAGRQSDETLCTPLCNQVGLEKEMQAT